MEKIDIKDMLGKFTFGEGISDFVKSLKKPGRKSPGPSTGVKRHERRVNTGRKHRDKNGKILCDIFAVIDHKPQRYSGVRLRQLRAERGVGSVRRIKKNA